MKLILYGVKVLRYVVLPGMLITVMDNATQMGVQMAQSLEIFANRNRP